MKPVVMFLVLVLANLAVCSPTVSSLRKRQNDCDVLPTLSVQCSAALARVNAFLSTISNMPADHAALTKALGDLCGSACYDQVKNFYKCTGSPLTGSEDFFVHGICCKNGNDYCLALLGDGKTPTIPSECVITCSSGCRATLNQIHTKLGCCAASVFNITGSPLVGGGSAYTTCNLSLGPVCSGAAGLIYLGMTVLVAVSFITATIL